MIAEIVVEGCGEAKVWLDELPATFFKSQKLKRATMTASNFINYKNVSGAIEMKVFKGPIILYGLLGMRFISTDDGHLDVALSINNDISQAFTEAIVAKPETAIIGLPEEYAISVLESIIHTQQIHRLLPSGNLEINCGAHGLVGSNPIFFGLLAEVLSRLMSLQLMSANQKQIKTCVLQAIKRL